MYHYERRFGEFYLTDDNGHCVYHKGSKVLGLVVSIDNDDNTFCLHKHGNYDWVQKYFNDSKQKFQTALNNAKTSDEKEVYQGLISGLRLYRIENCDLNELNHILNTSALPLKLLRFLVAACLDIQVIK
jgi:hypothetical protein